MIVWLYVSVDWLANFSFIGQRFTHKHKKEMVRVKSQSNVKLDKTLRDFEGGGLQQKWLEITMSLKDMTLQRRPALILRLL